MVAHQKSFKDSNEAAVRRLIRTSIRNAKDLTPAERFVTLALVNHFFHHKGKGNPVQPGRARLAKSAKVSIKTVSRTLSKLEAAGALVKVGDQRRTHYESGHWKATAYWVSVRELLTLCGCSFPEEVTMTASWVIPRSAKMSHGEGPKCPTVAAPQPWAKMSHTNYNSINVEVSPANGSDCDLSGAPGGDTVA